MSLVCDQTWVHFVPSEDLWMWAGKCEVWRTCWHLRTLKLNLSSKQRRGATKASVNLDQDICSVSFHFLTGADFKWTPPKTDAVGGSVYWSRNAGSRCSPLIGQWAQTLASDWLRAEYSYVTLTTEILGQCHYRGLSRRYQTPDLAPDWSERDNAGLSLAGRQSHVLGCVCISWWHLGNGSLIWNMWRHGQIGENSPINIWFPSLQIFCCCKRSSLKLIANDS